MLRMHFVSDEQDWDKLTLIEGLKKSLKKQTNEDERLTCLDCLKMLAINLGGVESESLWKDFQPILNELIANTQNQRECTYVVDSLALLCFIGNQDEKQTISILDNFFDIVQKKMNDADKKALETGYVYCLLSNWLFLLTSVSTSYVYDKIVPKIALFSPYLQDENISIRIIASEIITFLVQCTRDTEGEDFNFDNSLESYIDVHELLETLKDEKAKHIGKKDKAKQKGVVRDFKRSIELGETPDETLEFQHQKVKFDKWHYIIQLDKFREVLNEGLQTHFENNVLLHDIFDVTIERDKGKKLMTKAEKKKLFSPNSDKEKSRTKDISAKRDARRGGMEEE